MKRLGSLFDEMQPGPVLFFHLFDRADSPAQVSKLDEFLLDGLQSLMPLAVSDLSLGFVAAFPPVLLVQLLKLRDLGSEKRDLVAKHFQMIHAYQDNASRGVEGAMCPQLAGFDLGWREVRGSSASKDRLSLQAVFGVGRGNSITFPFCCGGSHFTRFENLLGM
jgi:hypothetical protein